MKLNNIMITTALIATWVLPALADNAGMPMKQGNMQMMSHDQGQMMKGGMGMTNPEMMQKRQAMMKKHMASMETRMANIEALLKELVELQKKK
jgi:hypothetical protein